MWGKIKGMIGDFAKGFNGRRIYYVDSLPFSNVMRRPVIISRPKKEEGDMDSLLEAAIEQADKLMDLAVKFLDEWYESELSHLMSNEITPSQYQKLLIELEYKYNKRKDKLTNLK